MGYRLPQTDAVIEFDDLPGLEVTVRISPVPLGAYFDAAEAMYDRGDRDVGAWLHDIATAIAPYLVAWNLDETPDLDGLLAQPFQLVLAIGRAWSNAVATVPVPFGRRSSDGVTSEATSPPGSSEPEPSTVSPEDMA